MRDIAPWLYSTFADVRANSDGTELMVACPFCNDTKHHLYVAQHTEIYHCFRCGAAGTWIDLVQKVTNLRYADAVAELEERRQTVADFTAALAYIANYVVPVRAAESGSRVPEGYVLLSTQDVLQTVQGNIAACYLESRKITPRQIAEHGIGICLNNKRLAMRIIILVEGGKYWQARAMYKTDRKYINPKMAKGDSIFNARALCRYEVAVTEGAFSAMAWGDSAVALLGKTPNAMQTRRLMVSPVKRYVLALDADVPSRMVWELAYTLTRGGRYVRVVRYEYGDPADDSPHKVYEATSSNIVRGLYSEL